MATYSNVGYINVAEVNDPFFLLEVERVREATLMGQLMYLFIAHI